MKQLYIIACIIFAIAAVTATMKAFKYSYQEMTLAEETYTPPPIIPAKQKSAGRKSYKDIANRNLFDVQRGTPRPSKDDPNPDKLETPSIANYDITVRGIVGIGESKAALISYANKAPVRKVTSSRTSRPPVRIVRSSSKKSNVKAYGIGDAIEDTGYKIKSINIRDVTLSDKAGQLLTISIDFNSDDVKNRRELAYKNEVLAQKIQERSKALAAAKNKAQQAKNAHAAKARTTPRTPPAPPRQAHKLSGQVISDKDTKSKQPTPATQDRSGSLQRKSLIKEKK